MTDQERSRYFGYFWPAACEARGWRENDSFRRRQTTAECMEKIRGLKTESVTLLGHDEVTALFCYLDHLAHPSDLERAQRWVDCMADYRAFNRARQADWYERQTYGSRGAGKLTRNRFRGEATAQGKPQDVFDPAAIQKRFVTMASRHRKKVQKQAAGALRQHALRELADPDKVPF